MIWFLKLIFNRLCNEYVAKRRFLDANDVNSEDEQCVGNKNCLEKNIGIEIEIIKIYRSTFLIFSVDLPKRSEWSNSIKLTSTPERGAVKRVIKTCFYIGV